MAEQQNYDLIIVGGGLVGLSLYLALKDRLQVALVDNQKPSFNPSEENRGIALSWASMQILANLGLKEQLTRVCYPIKTINVSECAKFGVTRLRAEDYAKEYLGAVIDFNNLLNLIAKQCGESLEQQFFGFQLAHSERTEDGWHVQISDDQGTNLHLTAPLLVAADGTRSKIRDQVGINFQHINFKQAALVTNITLEQEHQNQAFERFIGDGVLAVLPFGDKRVKCVWTAATTIIDELNALSHHQLKQAIQQKFGYRLGYLQSVESPIVYPLHQVVADKVTSKRTVLIGNAAQTLHPIAAQGFNLGLRDVAFLAETLLQNTELSLADKLSDYASKRGQDQTVMADSIHKLHEIFHSNHSVIQKFRSVALALCNELPAAKKKIAALGMGTANAMPQLVSRAL